MGLVADLAVGWKGSHLSPAPPSLCFLSAMLRAAVPTTPSATPSRAILERKPVETARRPASGQFSSPRTPWSVRCDVQGAVVTGGVHSVLLEAARCSEGGSVYVPVSCRYVWAFSIQSSPVLTLWTPLPPHFMKEETGVWGYRCAQGSTENAGSTG